MGGTMSFKNKERLNKVQNKNTFKNVSLYVLELKNPKPKIQF